MPFDVHISENNIEGTVPTLSPSPVITPPKSSSRGPLSDLTGWPSYSVMCTQAPGGGSSGGVPESGGFSRCSEKETVLHNCDADVYSGLCSGTPSRAGRGLGVFQQPSQLPTPQRYVPSHVCLLSEEIVFYSTPLTWSSPFFVLLATVLPSTPG
jgi:hypothetical protein